MKEEGTGLGYKTLMPNELKLNLLPFPFPIPLSINEFIRTSSLGFNFFSNPFKNKITFSAFTEYHASNVFYIYLMNLDNFHVN